MIYFYLKKKRRGMFSIEFKSQSHQKKKKKNFPGIVVHTYSSSCSEADAGRSLGPEVWVSQGNIERPYIFKKMTVINKQKNI
jgi:hypothetical protein